MRSQVRISCEHLHTLVSGNHPDLHDVQISVFEKTTGGLMAQIMEAEILKPGLFCHGAKLEQIIKKNKKELPEFQVTL
jgi:hypothetical protein